MLMNKASQLKEIVRWIFPAIYYLQEAYLNNEDTGKLNLKGKNIYLFQENTEN